MEQEIIVKEELPYPYVHYADTFIGFHNALDSGIFLCSCQKEAIENHLQMCVLFEEEQEKNEYHGWIAGLYAYPSCVTRFVETYRDPACSLLKFIKFEDALCHRCNGRMPTVYYGSSEPPSNYFASHFNPYINQACYTYGVSPSGHVVLPSKCPDELKEVDFKERLAIIENEVRNAFFFPRIGINGNQESALFLLVRQILPTSNVIRHFRAQWLEALELDIFIEDFNVGIEFQGVQHTRPMEHLGGAKAFKAIQRRDRRKARLCEQNGVTLLYVNEGEDLTDKHVRQLLHQAIPSVSLISPQEVFQPPFNFYVTSKNGNRSRWTYHRDRHSLSVSGDFAGTHVYMAGCIFDLTVVIRNEKVESLRMQMRKPSGSIDVTLPVSEDDPQVVECHRKNEPMTDFFRIWSMFEPNIYVQAEETSE